MKPIHAPQAQSHQSVPAAPMSHRMSAAIGSPISAPSSVDLTVSVSQSFQVILLKPKRSSSRKVCHSVNGSSSRPPMTAKAASSASCCTMPPPSHTSSSLFSRSSPPSSVQPSSRAAPQAISMSPKRALAMV
ncbi:hypothetical protein D3C72_1586430 [compost metagenome]